MGVTVYFVNQGSTTIPRVSTAEYVYLSPRTEQASGGAERLFLECRDIDGLIIGQFLSEHIVGFEIVDEKSPAS